MSSPPFDPSMFYAGLLTAACAEDRMWGISRWTEYLGADADLLPLLDDDAPVVRPHGGALQLVEIRAAALVALQDRHRGAGHGWPYGPVTVRRAMPADQVTARSAELTAGLDRGRRAALGLEVDRLLDRRVQPPREDEPLCRGYLLLQLLGAVGYERQQVDPQTLLTSLQQQIHASQLRAPRPLPHLRVDGDDGPIGYLYRDPHWRVDVVESPEGRDLAALVDRVRRIDRDGMPRVRATADGVPVRTADGAFRLDGVVPEDDVEGYLRAVAAFVSRSRRCEVVTEGTAWRYGPDVFAVDHGPGDPDAGG